MVPGSRVEPTLHNNELKPVKLHWCWCLAWSRHRALPRRETVEINCYRTPAILPLEFALGELCRVSQARNQLC